MIRVGIDKKESSNNRQSFKDVLENGERSKTVKYITIGQDFDNDEIDYIMKITDKIISEKRNVFDVNL